jgi:hypothetical protein
MTRQLAGRGGVASLAVAAFAMAVGAPVSASAQEWFRIPSLYPATEAELGPVSRTGFILAPDFEINDELSLGGTCGALLEDTEGFAIGAKLGYDKQIGDVVVGVMTDGFYSFADGNGRGAGAGVFESELNSTARCVVASATRSAASWPTARVAMPMASSRSAILLRALPTRNR